MTGHRDKARKQIKYLHCNQVSAFHTVNLSETCQLSVYVYNSIRMVLGRYYIGIDRFAAKIGIFETALHGKIQTDQIQMRTLNANRSTRIVNIYILKIDTPLSLKCINHVKDSKRFQFYRKYLHLNLPTNCYLHKWTIILY